MKVGDYVRTKNGLIFKIIDGNGDNWDLDISFGMLETFEDNWLELYRYNDNGSFFDNKNIVKSSPNIIDLIEVGDYVNGCLIVEINKDPFIKGQINLWTNMIVSEGEPFPNEYYKKKILAKDIKSIVTKEQMESMKYKVKE